MPNLTYHVVKPGDHWIFDPSFPHDPPGQYKGRETLVQLWETDRDGKLAGCVMALTLRDFFRTANKVNAVDGMLAGDVFLTSTQAKDFEDALRVHHERDYQIAVPKKDRLALGEFKKKSALGSVVMPVIKSFLNNFANATTSDLHIPGPRL